MTYIYKWACSWHHSWAVGLYRSQDISILVTSYLGYRISQALSGPQVKKKKKTLILQSGSTAINTSSPSPLSLLQVTLDRGWIYSLLEIILLCSQQKEGDPFEHSEFYVCP